MRRILALAIVLVVVQVDSAFAGSVIPATNYKTLVGVRKSDDPLAEVATDNGEYLSVRTAGNRNGARSAYQLTFASVPSDRPAGINIHWSGKVDVGTCDLTISLWHWRRERFVFVDSLADVGVSERSITAVEPDDAGFYRRGKVKAKFLCAGDDPFAFETDLAQLTTA